MTWQKYSIENLKGTSFLRSKRSVRRQHVLGIHLGQLLFLVICLIRVNTLTMDLTQTLIAAGSAGKFDFLTVLEQLHIEYFHEVLFEKWNTSWR
jgi:hypothetical protein